MNHQFLRHKVVINWVIPLVITALIFSLVQPAFAQIFEQDTNLAQYVTSNNVEVGSEVVDGYHQVFYIYQGDKIFITEGSQNSTLPVSNGEFMAFRKSIGGVNQIFLYHIPSGETIQLTYAGNNTNPKLSQGKVVWEGWIEDGWQVFLFDGKAVRQLTVGDVSVNPDIQGDEIVYARKNNRGEWRAVRYALREDRAQIVKEGLVAKNPRFRDGKIIFELEELLKERERKEDEKKAEAERRAEEEKKKSEEEGKSKKKEEKKKSEEDGTTIIIEKQTIPDGSLVEFTFTGDVAGILQDGDTVSAVVASGTYTATETALEGWNLTDITCDDDNSSGNTDTGVATFNVEEGETVTCVFTNTEKEVEPPAPGSIHGTKWEDGNGNGVRDKGEAGLSGWTIEITDGDEFNDSTVTDENGAYVFMNLDPGTYTVTEVGQAGWTQTTTNPDPIVFGEEDIVEHVDFGNQKEESDDGEEEEPVEEEVVKEEPTEPETVTEEDIIEELEGTPLVEEGGEQPIEEESVVEPEPEFESAQSPEADSTELES